jgi:hypothetical protein
VAAGGGDAAVYWLTLNHWVTLFNLGRGQNFRLDVAAGGLQSADFSGHLSVPLAAGGANSARAEFVFRRVRGADARLLARSVAMLPHDRTDAQRKRERSDFSFLTTGSAWLPPVLAVLVCGLQLTFWEHATNWTGEMFDLLLFAVVIWSLLEYRLDEREWRLFLARSFMARAWRTTGRWSVFPGFHGDHLAARRGLSFFGAVAFSAAAGGWRVRAGGNVVLPAAAAAAADAGVPGLAWRWRVSCFICFTPFFWLGASGWSLIRRSAPGTTLVWPADVLLPRRVERRLLQRIFLLIFGKKLRASGAANPRPLQWLDRLVVAGVWLLAVVAVAGLAYRNAPQIRDTNGDTFRRYTSLVEENLPRRAAIC